MADNDNRRRLRPSENPTVRRPAREQAHQDVSDITVFLTTVQQRRASGQSTPTPRPARDVLGSFGSSPRDQTMIQVLAAAATARHLGGAQSANAQRWERLAHENASRLEALRAQQHHREQAAHRAARMTPEQIQQRDIERANAESGSDKRMFDAAAAVALGYVAARALPPFDKLESLSADHLNVPHPETTFGFDPGTEHSPEQDQDLEAPTDPETEPAVEQDAGAEADLSSELETVTTQQPERESAPDNRMGEALQRAGRGLAAAIGPTHGDDEVEPNLSPVNLAQLSEELLGALGAAKLGHPRSVKEMLNVEREPDQTNAVAFIHDVGAEVDLGVSAGD